MLCALGSELTGFRLQGLRLDHYAALALNKSFGDWKIKILLLLMIY